MVASCTGSRRRATPGLHAGVALCGLLGATAVLGVYHEPTRRLVLNEVIVAGPGDQIRLPLYLSRRGTYFAEIYLEPAPGAAAVVPARLTLAFTIKVTRRDRVLVSKGFDVTLAPGGAGETLFWMESPRDVPERKDLIVVVDIGNGARVSEAYNLRLQIQRKPNLFPFGR